MPQPLAPREASPTPAVAPLSPPVDRLEWILRNLVWRALEETHASSAAIGAMHDNAMTCRAVAGLSLAQVGAPIDTESGLTAMAVRREMSQWCTDSETDWRVDAEVCRRLNVRSMIVVPVLSARAQSVVGVLAIFSVAPDAFSLDSLNTLKKLAHWVGEALEPANRTVSPQDLPAAKLAATYPPLGFYSEPTYGTKIKKYLAKIWRALASASRGQNERTG